jgi:hypothetical protein
VREVRWYPGTADQMTTVQHVTPDCGGERNLKQAAAYLGVHYMTAYRYVRTGRLGARRLGTEWVGRGPHKRPVSRKTRARRPFSWRRLVQLPTLASRLARVSVVFRPRGDQTPSH